MILKASGCVHNGIVHRPWNPCYGVNPKQHSFLQLALSTTKWVTSSQSKLWIKRYTSTKRFRDDPSERSTYFTGTLQRISFLKITCAIVTSLISSPSRLRFSALTRPSDVALSNGGYWLALLLLLATSTYFNSYFLLVQASQLFSNRALDKVTPIKGSSWGRWRPYVLRTFHFQTELFWLSLAPSHNLKT